MYEIHGTYLKSDKAQGDDQDLLHLNDLAVLVEKRCISAVNHGGFLKNSGGD